MNFKNKLKTSFTIILLFAICLISACAKEEGSKRATAFDIFGITEKNPDKNTKEIVFTDDGGFERNKQQISDAEVNTLSADGSQITTLKDAFGNTTHQRVFPNDLRIKKILMVSNSDGEKITYLYGQNGKVVRTTDEKNFLEMSADDIAELADLQQPVKGNSFEKPKIPSSLPVENSPVPNQSQPGYYENYKNEFPRLNEKDFRQPAPTQTENTENNPQNPPQTAENN